MKKIARLLKYLEGSKILKFANPAGPITPDINRLARIGKLAADYGISKEQAAELVDDDEAYDNFIADRTFSQQNGFNSLGEKLDQSLQITENNPVSEQERLATETRTRQLQSIKYKPSPELSDKAKAGIGMASELAAKAFNIADEATMGDKNFSASSQAIDTAVHGASSALMKSGNPWAMAAGAALEGLNFATKAGGKNVPGYDVNITNSGYGTMGHQESEAGRVWDSWFGITDKKLRKRNEQARMALIAADISEDQAFEQEARSNSVTNILQLNQIALAGGIDTSLLGS